MDNKNLLDLCQLNLMRDNIEKNALLNDEEKEKNIKMIDSRIKNKTIVVLFENKNSQKKS
jgi:hypothetical protein